MAKNREETRGKRKKVNGWGRGSTDGRLRKNMRDRNWRAEQLLRSTPHPLRKKPRKLQQLSIYIKGFKVPDERQRFLGSLQALFSVFFPLLERRSELPFSALFISTSPDCVCLSRESPPPLSLRGLCHLAGLLALVKRLDIRLASLVSFRFSFKWFSDGLSDIVAAYV